MANGPRACQAAQQHATLPCHQAKTPQKKTTQSTNQKKKRKTPQSTRNTTKQLSWLGTFTQQTKQQTAACFAACRACTLVPTLVSFSAKPLAHATKRKPRPQPSSCLVPPSCSIVHGPPTQGILFLGWWWWWLVDESVCSNTFLIACSKPAHLGFPAFFFPPSDCCLLADPKGLFPLFLSFHSLPLSRSLV